MVFYSISMVLFYCIVLHCGVLYCIVLHCIVSSWDQLSATRLIWLGAFLQFLGVGGRMVSAVVALLRYRVTAVTVVTASAAERNIPIWLPPR